MIDLALGGLQGRRVANHTSTNRHCPLHVISSSCDRVGIAGGSSRKRGRCRPALESTTAVTVKRAHCTCSIRTIAATFDCFDDARTKDHAFKQRVGRQSIRTVHARTRNFASCPQPRKAARALQVGDNSPAQVMRSRRNRQKIGSGIKIKAAEHCGNSWKTNVELIEARHVEQTMIGMEFDHSSNHRPTDLIAWKHFVNKSFAIDVTNQRAVATQCFRQ